MRRRRVEHKEIGTRCPRTSPSQPLRSLLSQTCVHEHHSWQRRPTSSQRIRYVSGPDINAASCLAFISRHEPYVTHSQSPENKGASLAAQTGTIQHRVSLRLWQPAVPSPQLNARLVGHRRGVVSVSSRNIAWTWCALRWDQPRTGMPCGRTIIQVPRSNNSVTGSSM